MEISLNFVLFEELKENPDGTQAESRIVIIRESRSPDVAPGEGTTGPHPLE
jgi:hypothetical protein